MGSEDYKNLKNNGKKIIASGNNVLFGSDSKCNKYKINLKPVDVAILHPSFLCPVLKKTGDEFSIIVLTDKLFFNTYEKCEGNENKKAGPALSGAVSRYIKIASWSEIDKSQPANKPLFGSLCEAQENIEVHYLWKLGELEENVLTNKDEKIFAQIDHRVMKMYQEKGLEYGFEIVIKSLPDESTGLFDISWMNYSKPKTEGEDGYFFEMQDVYVNTFNKEYRNAYHDLKCDVSNSDVPSFTEEFTEIQSYHPLYISDKESLDIGHLSDVHVSSRQHVFTQSKARLIDGKEGDGNRSAEIGGMVNTSYATLKKLMEEMAKDTDLLIFTGDLIDYNRNLNPDNFNNDKKESTNSSDIWSALDLERLKDKQKYPVGIDNLVMYELFRDYYKKYNKPIMLVSGNHEAYTLPYGISPRVKLSRAISNSLFSGKMVPMLDEDGDPVYDEDGFQEYEFAKYTEEEVIDKSIKEAEEDAEEIKDEENPDIYFDRANEGIPADHNLTISEAILMYGPDYAKIVMAASSDYAGERNFKPENLAWFYHIFTPLSSYISIYGEQCFIGLGWGDNEKFVGVKQGSWSLGGFLPRATESISDPQLSILNAALDEDKSCNVLCSHFTYANYNTPQAFSEEGSINSNDLFGSLGKHDYGTFESNRNDVYKNITENKIHYTLSGHSHRSGLYQVKDSDTSWVPGRDTMSVIAQATKENKFEPKDGCRMMVAACGGPIAVQNHDNELFNWGLDYPSGNYIKFNGSNESELGIKTPGKKQKQAQPRLAVALDYADIFLRDKKHGGLIKEFISNDDDGEFTIRVNPKANISGVDAFNEVNIVLYNDEIPLVSNGKMELKKIDEKKGDIYTFTPDVSIRKQLKDSERFNQISYLSIKLNSSGNKKSFNHYDETSNWIYLIHVLKRSEIEEIDEDYEDEYEYDYLDEVGGYVLERHSINSEIPDFGWYARKFPHEYN